MQLLKSPLYVFIWIYLTYNVAINQRITGDIQNSHNGITQRIRLSNQTQQTRELPRIKLLYSFKDTNNHETQVK